MTAPARGSRRARIAHVVLILVGLVIFLYPLTAGAAPAITCRGVEMRAGDTCSKAQNGGVQTYEQRLRTARQARPVVLAVGALVVAFGSWLLVVDVRDSRRRSPAEPVRPAA
jgi:hypothetical protein